MKIASNNGYFEIGNDNPPFIIAEMSGNHNGSLEQALKLVEAAAEAGAHALKIQTYTADTMTLDIDVGEFLIQDPSSLWDGSTLYELYKKASTPWEWHKPIFNLCSELGMIGFSSPFDATAVDFLESLDVPLFKIASFEMTDIPLIKKVASTGKPIIMSTGMATIGEISESVSVARAFGCKDLALLKCTSAYPASPADINLNTIPHMKELFDCEVGLSDHTLGLGVSIASVAVGASIIEKHFTLDRNDGGVDSAFSLEPDEVRALVSQTQAAKPAMGGVEYRTSTRELLSSSHRRSIYVSADIKSGEEFTADNTRVIRPGHGLKPKYYEDILGKVANVDISRGTPLRWNLVE